MKKNKLESAKLRAETICKAISEKQGIDINLLDFSKIENSVSAYFIICHGESSVQVRAIADFVDEVVKKQYKEDPWFVEGYNNAEWILLDYADIVVHIFQKDKRNFYKLEDLWADAEIQQYSE